MSERAEHNCHLCKKEWLGRCFGTKNYGKDVSVEDTPVCDEYEYGDTIDKIDEQIRLEQEPCGGK